MRIFFILFFILLATKNFSQLSAAEISEHQAELYTPHYAFSNYFGSGLYSSTGQNITVFNIPLFYEPEQTKRNRYRFRLPISFGFYNFDVEDIPKLNEDAATLTLTLGIEFDHWVNDQLKLVPFLDIGFTQDFNNNEEAAIYASGLSAYYYFSAWDEEHIWLTRFQRAGFRTHNNSISDGFSSFETGVDLKLPFRMNMLERSTYITTYVVGYWFTIDLLLDPNTADPRRETNAQEVGFTIGTESPLDFYFFDLDRIGIGYRYSKNAPNIIRLTFNMPLD